MLICIPFYSGSEITSPHYLFPYQSWTQLLLFPKIKIWRFWSNYYLFRTLERKIAYNYKEIAYNCEVVVYMCLRETRMGRETSN